MKTTLGPGFRRGDAIAPSSFRRKPGSSVVIALALLFSTAPLRAEEWVSLEKTDGAALFGEKCGMCHRATGMGTGILARRMSADLALLENRTDLQAEFVRTAVRKGFGVMFPISRGEVSDPQLDALVAYLVKDGSAAAGTSAVNAESAATGASGERPAGASEVNAESAATEVSAANAENAQ